MKPKNNNQELIDGLKSLAKWYESHPDAPVSFSAPTFYVWADDAEHFAKCVKMIGPCTKRESNGYFDVFRMFGPIELQAIIPRGQICDKVSLGTKTITKEVPDPNAPTITITEEVEQFEWKCPESILALGAK